LPAAHIDDDDVQRWLASHPPQWVWVQTPLLPDALARWRKAAGAVVLDVQAGAIPPWGAGDDVLHLWGGGGAALDVPWEVAHVPHAERAAWLRRLWAHPEALPQVVCVRSIDVAALVLTEAQEAGLAAAMADASDGAGADVVVEVWGDDQVARVDRRGLRSVVWAELPTSLAQAQWSAWGLGHSRRGRVVVATCDDDVQQLRAERAVDVEGLLHRWRRLQKKQPAPMRDAERLCRAQVARQTPLGVVATALSTTQADARLQAFALRRRRQTHEVVAWVSFPHCRMLQHQQSSTSYGPCGLCDVCAPSTTWSAQLRSASDAEHLLAHHLMRHIPWPCGLHTALWHARRLADDGELLLEALWRARCIHGVVQDVVGDQTPQVVLHQGPEADFAQAELTVCRPWQAPPAAGMAPPVVTATPEAPTTTARGEAQAAVDDGNAEAPQAQASAATALPDEEGSSVDAADNAADNAADMPDPDPDVVERLRGFRKAESLAQQVPPYFVLTNRVIDAIAAHKPASLDELAGIHGVGEKKLEQYGDRVLQLVAAPAAEPCST